ncbi:nuclear transport factor 2 family protein [Desulfobacula sp.]|uniref:nuclear transport factor 2 family protein n=1 Tax=Desulfobacula sp. TaxID=2593537 RepID=UPI00260F3D5B|nr:nuclear transport factor 2 family protein [Desulfobacula sp.]
MIGALIAKSKVTSSYDLLNRKDIDSFLANWHDESTFIYPGNIGAGGEFKGKKAIKEFFQKLFEQFPTFNITLKNVCVKNIIDFVGTNVVTVEWLEENINKNGDKVQVSGVTVITLKFGKATYAKDYIFTTDEELKKAWGE